jgi:hypothetical protein
MARRTSDHYLALWAIALVSIVGGGAGYFLTSVFNHLAVAFATIAP